MIAPRKCDTLARLGKNQFQCLFTPDVTNRTKSNVRLIELNRTQSNPITRLGSIEFDNRTQSNPHKKIGLIEPNRTFKWVRLVRLGSIEFDGFHGWLKILIIIMFYLTTCVDIFKFIEGLCASLRLLSDLPWSPMCWNCRVFFGNRYTVNNSIVAFNCFTCKYGSFIYLTLSCGCCVEDRVLRN